MCIGASTTAKYQLTLYSHLKLQYFDMNGCSDLLSSFIVFHIWRSSSKARKKEQQNLSHMMHKKG